MRSNAVSRPVLLFQRIVPSYRVPVFRSLYDSLGVITCHTDAEIQGNPSYHAEMGYPNILLEGGFVFGRVNLFSQRVYQTLRRERPAVVICEMAYGNITFWKLLFLRKLFCYKLVGWSHGIKNKDISSVKKSRHYRTVGHVVGMLDAVLVYSAQRADLLRRLVPSAHNKIFVANNTLDTTEYRAIYARHSREPRAKNRQMFGLEDVFTMCYIGRLQASKRIDLLVSAWEMLRQKRRVNLIVIGSGHGGAMLEKYTISDGLFWEGEIRDPAVSGRYLSVSDVMIIPGAVGLSLIHAFCFALPVITTDRSERGPMHGPEFDYLVDGYNGLICQQTADGIASAVTLCMDDARVLKDLRIGAERTIEEFAGISSMVDGFRQVIAFVRDSHS